jgi:hypothetical protein
LGGGMTDTALAMLTAGIAASHLPMHSTIKKNYIVGINISYILK